VVRKANGQSRVLRAKFEDVAKTIGQAKGETPTRRTGALAKIHQALQPALSEMFFTSRLILVEGLEDVAYITTYLNLLGLWDKYRRLGCHIIPVDGKSELLQPLAIAKCLEIPAFVVFDSDGDKPDSNGSKEKHRKDNTAILRLCGFPNPEPFPSATFWDDQVVMWASDIGKTVEDEIGKQEWMAFRAEADKEYGHTAGLRKNTLHIATSLLLAWQQGKRSSGLEELCQRVIKFSQSGG
jgi:predicted ATP-dependent endonuclease of OLD family